MSTASLIVGGAAAHAWHDTIKPPAPAGLVAGAMSMATGEYVSLHSPAGTENAALAQERLEIPTDFAANIMCWLQFTLHLALALATPRLRARDGTV